MAFLDWLKQTANNTGNFLKQTVLPGVSGLSQILSGVSGPIGQIARGVHRGVEGLQDGHLEKIGQGVSIAMGRKALASGDPEGQSPIMKRRKMLPMAMKFQPS